MLKIIVSHGRQNKAAFRSLKQLPARTRRGIDKAFREERVLLKRDTIKGFEDTKTGRIYRVYVSKTGRKLKRGRWHQASTPNQTPAVLSGKLKRSLGFEMKRGSTLVYGANTPYAKKHEMSGRSYLRRSIDNRREAIGQRLCRNIRREITRAK